MTALAYLQFDERMVGEASPDFDDTMNRALKQVVDLSDATPSAFEGFALRPPSTPTVGQFYVATDTNVAASWQTLVSSMVTDLTTASTGITKVGTINTGVWQGSSIATTYTDAKVKTVTGVADKITIGGTATDPTFTIASTYAGQASIVTLGTIATGVWHGTAIDTPYTVAQVVSLSGVSNRTTITGTATVPIVDISATYVGQSSITTVGTIAAGTWQGTAIADTYLSALSVSKLTGTTLPASIVSSSLTTLGTIATGVWNGTAISTSFTTAQVISVAGTSNRISIGGTGTSPTVDISNAYVGQATITTLGVITVGTWTGTAVGVAYGGTALSSFTIGDTIYASGATTLSKLGIGTAGQFKVVNGGATAPAWHTLVTADVTDLTSASTGITKVGTIATGVWQGTVVGATYGGTGVNNGSSTVTLGGSLTFSGAFTTTFTVTGNTSVTLPTSGTLINSAVTSLASLTSVGGAFAISGAFTGATTASFSGAITYGGVTLTNAVTGTGSMVLSAAPTLTGAVTVSSTLAVGGQADFTDLLRVTRTTLQASLRYDISNRLDITVSSAGLTTFASVGASAGVAFSSTVAIGTSPATVGSLRLPNDTTGAINWRNAAGSGNIAGIYVDAFDGLIIGTGAAITYLPGAMTVAGTLTINGTLSSSGVAAQFASVTSLGDLSTVGGRLIVTSPSTPGSAGATGTVGTVAWDTGFIYIAVGTNSWKRVAIAAW